MRPHSLHDENNLDAEKTMRSFLDTEYEKIPKYTLKDGKVIGVKTSKNNSAINSRPATTSANLTRDNCIFQKSLFLDHNYHKINQTLESRLEHQKEVTVLNSPSGDKDPYKYF